MKAAELMYIVVYSITNNRQWQAPNWMTVGEYETLDEAKIAYGNFCQISDDRETSYLARDAQPVITQVAVFRLAGGETFERKPRLYHDNRDKTGWPINPVVADWSIGFDASFTTRLK